MWLAGARVLDLYLGTRLAVLCDGNRLLERQQVPDAATGLAAAAEWLGPLAQRAKLRVWLSGALGRPFIVEAVAGLRGSDETRRVTQSQAQRALGCQEPCRVWMEQSTRHGQRVAAAASEVWLGQVEQTMAQLKWPLNSIAPWWADVLRHQSAAAKRRAMAGAGPQAWVLAVHDCDSLTVLAGAGKHFNWLRTVAPIDDAASARAALSRSMLSQNMPDATPVWVSLRTQADSTPTLQSGLSMAPIVELPP